MDVILRRLARAAARRGLSGDGWPWLVLGVAAFTLHRARRDAGDRLETVRLHPGESIAVTVAAPRQRDNRQRRRERHNRQRRQEQHSRQARRGSEG